jgi:hypothetical protein
MPVSFAKDISHLFRAGDIQCMKNYFVYLDDYSYMSDAASDADFADHANARRVHARLVGTITPRMPQGGPYWPQEQLDLFQTWMTDGFLP